MWGEGKEFFAEGGSLLLICPFLGKVVSALLEQRNQGLRHAPLGLFVLAVYGKEFSSQQHRSFGISVEGLESANEPVGILPKGTENTATPRPIANPISWSVQLLS